MILLTEPTRLLFVAPYYQEQQSIGGGRASCVPCPPGSYSPVPGSVRCPNTEALLSAISCSLRPQSILSVRRAFVVVSGPWTLCSFYLNPSSICPLSLSLLSRLGRDSSSASLLNPSSICPFVRRSVLNRCRGRLEDGLRTPGQIETRLRTD